jgi:hypothetical protein
MYRLHISDSCFSEHPFLLLRHWASGAELRETQEMFIESVASIESIASIELSGKGKIETPDAQGQRLIPEKPDT